MPCLILMLMAGISYPHVHNFVVNSVDKLAHAVYNQR